MTSTPLKTSDISIIIPALNEASRIQGLAATLLHQVGEIILVDGGSTDDTAQKAGEQGFTVLNSQPGRSHQMNTGARQAKGTILLFLHADTILPEQFARSILNIFADGTTALCAFSLGVDTKNLLLKAIVGMANIRSRFLKLPYGDQALALRAATFRKLGGFPETAIMEDYELVRKAAKHGDIITMEKQVITSDRRWRRFGVLQTTLVNQLVVIGYKVGISPDKLASFYRNGLFGSN